MPQNRSQLRSRLELGLGTDIAELFSGTNIGPLMRIFGLDGGSLRVKELKAQTLERIFAGMHMITPAAVLLKR